MKKEFNQLEYIKEFNKENYKQFNVKLRKEEFQSLTDLLNAYNIPNADFLRNSIENFKEELKMKKFYVKSGTFSCEKRGKWIYNGDVFVGNDNAKIFDDIIEARNYYDNIVLNDKIEENYRYTDYKAIYEISRDIDDVDDIDLDEAKLIIDECPFVNYE